MTDRRLKNEYPLPFPAKRLIFEERLCASGTSGEWGHSSPTRFFYSGQEEDTVGAPAAAG
jgi:hypothetical protein